MDNKNKIQTAGGQWRTGGWDEEKAVHSLPRSWPFLPHLSIARRIPRTGRCVAHGMTRRGCRAGGTHGGGRIEGNV